MVGSLKTDLFFQKKCDFLEDIISAFYASKYLNDFKI